VQDGDFEAAVLVDFVMSRSSIAFVTSLIAKRLDRIELGGAVRGVGSARERDDRREADRDQYRLKPRKRDDVPVIFTMNTSLTKAPIESPMTRPMAQRSSTSAKPR